MQLSGSIIGLIIQEQRQRQKAARGSRVVLYRRYREGELPDIQIKYSDVIRPLQALAQVRIRYPLYRSQSY